MIVRQGAGVIYLIPQPEHAQLAGLIMARSTALGEHPRRASILVAVAEHDNGWQEEDAAPLVQPGTGEVVDFVNAPLAVRHRVWPRAVARLEADPWAAALVAQHAITVYDRYRSDRAWDGFFAAMEAARDEMRRRSEGSLDDLLDDYVHVRLGDLISLAFCTGWTDEHRFGGWTVRLDGDHVGVSPDPFAGVTVPLRIAARELPKVPFANQQALSDSLRDARLITLTGSAGGSR